MPDENVSRVPFGRDAENRHGHLLAARAAVGDVQVAVAIEHRVVDLVQAGGERRADFDVRRLAGDAVDAHRRAAALRGRTGTMTRSRVGDANTHARRQIADRDLAAARPVDRETGAVDGDAAAFDGASAADGSDAGRTAEVIEVSR